MQYRKGEVRFICESLGNNIIYYSGIDYNIYYQNSYNFTFDK